MKSFNASKGNNGENGAGKYIIKARKLISCLSIAESMQVGKPTVPMEGAMTMSQPAQQAIKKKDESSLSPFTSDAEDAKASKLHHLTPRNLSNHTIVSVEAKPAAP